MPTPNEVPGVSLIDRLQAENKKLKDENAELQKSIGKLQLFNKILEREVAELKSPVAEEPVAQNGFQKETGPPLPIKKIATYAIIGLLVIASIYAMASLFSGSKTPAAVTPAPAVTTVDPPKNVSPPAQRNTTVIPPTTITASQRLAMRIDTARRRRALMEDHTPYDSVGASDFSLGHYKVLSRAYFHTKPDDASVSELYINRLTKTSLEALDEKNGFVFVVFKNEAGKITRGWLKKSELKEVSR